MANAFDAKEKIEWIPCKNLSVIWAQAQRTLNETHADRIADEFDPEMFGTLAVTKPNGKGVYHIIDGHHRKVALEKKYGPDEKAPCQVFDAHDPERAAQLFDSINSHRKNLSPVEVFKVRVTAGLDDEVAIDKIVRASGYYVSSHAEHERAIACVSSLMRVYRSYGPQVLEDSLKTIKATWGDDQNATMGAIVSGYGEFLTEYGRYVNYVQLREKVAKRFTPGKLMATARAARELDGHSLARTIKSLLITTYNKGMGVKKLKRNDGKDE
jgi:hypothetical protein